MEKPKKKPCYRVAEINYWGHLDIGQLEGSNLDFFLEKKGSKFQNYLADNRDVGSNQVNKGNLFLSQPSLQPLKFDEINQT